MSDYILRRVHQVIDEFIKDQREEDNYIHGYLDTTKENAADKLLDGLRLAQSANFVQNAMKYGLYHNWYPGKLMAVNKEKRKKKEDGDDFDEDSIDISKSIIEETMEENEEGVIETEVKTEPTTAAAADSGEMKLMKPAFMWSHPVIPINGEPFLMNYVKSYSCCFGKNYHKPGSRSKIPLTEENGGDDDTEGNPPPAKKRRSSSSVKYECPAMLHFREFKTFPGYARYPNISKYKKNTLRNKLMEALCQGTVNSEIRVYVSIPLPAAHLNHPVGAESSMKLRMHPLVRKKIYQYVAEGCNDNKTIKSMLRQYVLNELCAEGMRPLPDNRSYYPTDKMINCHRLIAARYSPDQLHMINLQQKIHVWQKDFPDSKIFLCNGNEIHTSAQPQLAQYNSQGFLFIYQDSWQSDLLQQCGTVCYFDAAHRYIDGYDFRLYTLYVKVKEQLYLAALIVNLEDSTDALIDCIRVLLCWNPLWQPEHITVDFCYILMASLQIIFPETEVAVNDVIRNREFDGWCEKSTDQDVRTVFDHLNKMINNHSRVDLEIEKFAYDLSLTYLWQLSPEFRVWVSEDLPHFLKFVADKRSLVMKEEVHRLLKQKRLRFPDGSNIPLPHSNLALSNVLSYLITEHVQDVRQFFLMKHGDILHDEYFSEVPDYLKDRPKPFVRHCQLQKMAAENFKRSEIDRFGDDGTYSISLFPSCNQRVVFNLTTPVCECNIWQLTNNPCKHFFAAFNLCDETWFSLPDFYRNDPRITCAPLPAPKVEMPAMDSDPESSVASSLVEAAPPSGKPMSIAASAEQISVSTATGKPTVFTAMVKDKNGVETKSLLVPSAEQIKPPENLKSVTNSLGYGQCIIWVNQSGGQIPYLITKHRDQPIQVKSLQVVMPGDKSTSPDQDQLTSPIHRKNRLATSPIGNENSPTWKSKLLGRIKEDQMKTEKEPAVGEETSDEFIENIMERAKLEVYLKRKESMSDNVKQALLEKQQENIEKGRQLKSQLVSVVKTPPATPTITPATPAVTPINLRNIKPKSSPTESATSSVIRSGKRDLVLNKDEVVLLIPWNEQKLRSADKNGVAYDRANDVRKILTTCISSSFQIQNVETFEQVENLAMKILNILRSQNKTDLPVTATVTIDTPSSK
ncbi:uncharacterized protein LOC141900169 [Tubulanus polymorphus]|uniref:uncharacterized protein LOC141900169 n=1 Tax=Tubulanus polymorphus TaxID=672921 RepID=UPI003DA1FF88